MIFFSSSCSAILIPGVAVVLRILIKTKEMLWIKEAISLVRVVGVRGGRYCKGTGYVPSSEIGAEVLGVWPL